MYNENNENILYLMKSWINLISIDKKHCLILLSYTLRTSRRFKNVVKYDYLTGISLVETDDILHDMF